MIIKNKDQILQALQNLKGKDFYVDLPLLNAYLDEQNTKEFQPDYDPDFDEDQLKIKSSYQASVDPVLTNFILSQLLSTPGNSSCAHCHSLPTHASLNEGIFVCDKCSRAIGRFKSLFAEPWTEQQLKFMVLGGNAKYKVFEGEPEEYRLQLEQNASPLKQKTKAAKI